MEKQLQEMISKSSFKVEEGRYVYAKVGTMPASEKRHFMVTRDDDEITVVTRAENVETLDVIEQNKDSYRLIALQVAVPFYSVGFLAAVSDAIAKEGLNVLIVSTYAKDYLLIEEGCAERVRAVLTSLGFQSL